MPVSEEDGPHNGHLGTTWEIAIIIVFVVVVFAILGAVIFQSRRKKQRRRLEEAEAELGRQRGELEGEKGVASDMDGSSITVPEPTADPKRPSRSSREKTPGTPTSSYHASSHQRDRPSKKPPPPRYYWDQR